MNDYSAALSRYLEENGNKQLDLASKVNVQQASISRYKNGRLPPRDVAERIDAATSGRVPVSLWIAAATKKFGIAA